MVMAGLLKDRITLQAPTFARGSYGGPTKTWSDVATVWADVRDTVGRNLYQAMAEKSQVSVEIRLRWRQDIRPNWRVSFGTRKLEVIYRQDPTGRKSELILYCREIV